MNYLKLFLLLTPMIVNAQSWISPPGTPSPISPLRPIQGSSVPIVDGTGELLTTPHGDIWIRVIEDEERTLGTLQYPWWASTVYVTGSTKIVYVDDSNDLYTLVIDKNEVRIEAAQAIPVKWIPLTPAAPPRSSEARGKLPRSEVLE